MTSPNDRPGIIGSVIRFCLENKLIVFLVMGVALVWGLLVAPFDWDLGPLPRYPVPVDAIPDIGENQQIVFTRWMGRSPQDVEDQITYPLTSALLGLPKVRTIRSYSMFGFSTIYIIFEEDAEFYWSRSRVLEKLNSLPADTLPGGVRPALGPDATALGQVFWYTLEGRDPEGKPAGGWDLHELRTVQDWTVRYALMSAKGVSEVASVGGFVQEYQVDVDPDAMRAHGVTLNDVFNAVRMSNVDVGARTIEVNKVEYVVRGLGFVRNLDDLNFTVVKVTNNVPVYVKDVASVVMGPALRRGALDKGGAEAVGGVVVVRYGYNPLAAIQNVKKKIDDLAKALPKKPVIDWSRTNRDAVERFAREHNFSAFHEGVLFDDAWMHWLSQKQSKPWPAWVTVSQVTVVPFYDRTGLIQETLGTLQTALTDEILVTIIVVILMVLHLRSSLLISGLLPLAVLFSFIAMKAFHVDANIVALSGIAIAIGTIVDMGVVVCENILKHLEEAEPGEDRLEVIYRGASEVGGAVLTAVATTVVSFLPVFTMEAAEGKLFRPLAFTKTFALVASIVIALTLIPPLAHVLFGGRISRRFLRVGLFVLLAGCGIGVGWALWLPAGLVLIGMGAYHLTLEWLPERICGRLNKLANFVVAFLVALVLAEHWQPLGPEHGHANTVFVIGLLGGMMLLFAAFLRCYETILRFCLRFKYLFLPIPVALVIAGLLIWSRMGKEFMPPLDEGSYLYMPTTMPHASIGEAKDVLAKQDMAIGSIPEVEDVVGKIGRVESALDPAPVSMIETVINYKPKYVTSQYWRDRLADKKKGKQGPDRDPNRRLTFLYDPDAVDVYRSPDGAPRNARDGMPYKVQGKFTRDDAGRLIEDPDGMPFRLWRPALDPALNPGRKAWDGIRTPNDIWDQILDAASVPGTTSAPKLQPIAARLVMLQSGMRAPMGIKVKGPDLASIEGFALELEVLLKQVPSIQSNTVVADRIVGKPYLEIKIDRRAIARYGLHIRGVQDVIEVAVGGRHLTTSVEGRERYGIRVRYLRELRGDIEDLGGILIPAPNGTQVPLRQVAEVRYVRGPQVIKSEVARYVGYVVFDMKPGYAEVDVVNEARAFLKQKENDGQLKRPDGVEYDFAGSYKSQERAEKRLMVVLPLALLIIFLILYLLFRSVTTTLLVFSGVFVAWSGGFIMLGLYSWDGFLNFDVFDVSMRELFQVRPYNLSVAVWVGFLALFGIATDDGVIIATYLKQHFDREQPDSIQAIREATVHAGKRRIRPALMTVATTILALIPVLTSTGRGADIMVPMAIPSFGGMTVVIITVFVVPTLYCLVEEWKWRLRTLGRPPEQENGSGPRTAQAPPSPTPSSDAGFEKSTLGNENTPDPESPSPTGDEDAEPELPRN